MITGSTKGKAETAVKKIEEAIKNKKPIMAFIADENGFEFLECGMPLPLAALILMQTLRDLELLPEEDQVNPAIH